MNLLTADDNLLVAVVMARPTGEDIDRINKLLPDIKKWEEVQSLLIQHGSAPLLFKKLSLLRNSHLIPVTIQQALQQAYYHTLSRNMILFNALKEITGILKQSNIKVIVLKGGYLAPFLYEDIATRQLSDLDILVPEKDGETVTKILQSIGFSFSTNDVSIVSEFIGNHNHEMIHFVPLIRNGVSVEVHIRLHRTHSSYDIKTERFIENALPFNYQGIEAYGLALPDLLIHLCVHIDKHFGNEHIQMKCFNDLANLLVIYRNDLDWLALTENCRLHAAELVVFRYLLLTAEFYQVSIPEEIKERYSSQLDNTLRGKFMQFFHCEYDKKFFVDVHMDNIKGIRKWGDKLHYLFDLIFPPKAFMMQKYFNQLKINNEKLIMREKTFGNKLLIINYELFIKYWWLLYPYRWWIGVKGIFKLIIHNS